MFFWGQSAGGPANETLWWTPLQHLIRDLGGFLKLKMIWSEKIHCFASYLMKANPKSKSYYRKIGRNVDVNNRFPDHLWGFFFFCMYITQHKQNEMPSEAHRNNPCLKEKENILNIIFSIPILCNSCIVLCLCLVFDAFSRWHLLRIFMI